MKKPPVTRLFLSILGLAGSACAQEHAQGAPPAPARPACSRSGHDLRPLSPERIAEIVKTLPPEAVEVTQRAGTERAGTSPLLKNKEKGVYVSVVGGLPLFRSEAKFESGTGWPSFYEPVDPDHVVLREDRSHGMTRVEVLDARSGAHLGHVFDDGPKPTGKRYCINGAALKFIPDGAPLPPESQPAKLEKAYFAGGCFWGVEDVFQQVPGVVTAVSGYQGGRVEKPSYKQVCSDTTGHAESVEVTYDPARVSYKELLAVFFANHDPTTKDRQGPDVGSQYRSAVFAATPEQKKLAQEYVAELGKKPRFQKRPIVTRIEDMSPFFAAEEYHQDYHAKHGGSCRVQQPED